MAAGLLQIQGVLTGLASGQRPFGPMVQTTSVGATDLVNLSAGANTLTPPSGASYAIIVPPTANAQTITLKGITGDTGVALSKTKPAVISLDSVASFVLTAGGTITGVEVIWL